MTEEEEFDWLIFKSKFEIARKKDEIFKKRLFNESNYKAICLIEEYININDIRNLVSEVENWDKVNTIGDLFNNLHESCYLKEDIVLPNGEIIEAGLQQYWRYLKSRFPEECLKCKIVPNLY